MLKAVEEHLQTNGNCILMLVGTSSEIRQIMEASAVIGTLIQRKDMYRLQEYTLAEQVHWVQRFLKKKHFSLSTEAGKKLVKGLQERRDWKKEQLLGWLDKEVLPRFVRRVLLSEKKDDWYMKEMLAVIEASDIRFPEKENVLMNSLYPWKS